MGLEMGPIRSKESKHRDLLEVMQWMLRSTNIFYRGLYQHGLWIASRTAAVLVQHGYHMTAAWKT